MKQIEFEGKGDTILTLDPCGDMEFENSGSRTIIRMQEVKHINYSVESEELEIRGRGYDVMFNIPERIFNRAVQIWKDTHINIVIRKRVAYEEGKPLIIVQNEIH
jgi:hypothetical protein